MDLILVNQILTDTVLIAASIVGLILVILIPARVLQRRHGYTPWILVFGVVPYLGPLCLLWAFAVSTPKLGDEAS